MKALLWIALLAAPLAAQVDQPLRLLDYEPGRFRVAEGGWFKEVESMEFLDRDGRPSVWRDCHLSNKNFSDRPQLAALRMDSLYVFAQVRRTGKCGTCCGDGSVIRIDRSEWDSLPLWENGLVAAIQQAETALDSMRWELDLLRKGKR